MPYSLSTTLQRGFGLQLLPFIIATTLSAPAALNAQVMMCPDNARGAAVRPVTRPSTALRETAKLPINLQADSWDATVNGEINLTGNVQAIQGERTLSAEALHYNTATKDMSADGTVQYEDSELLVGGDNASMNSTGGASIADATFTLKATSGRGTASKVQLSPEGNVALDDVRYTTCPPGSVDWQLKLSDLDINQQTHTGTGRNVRLDFMSVPIFYTPWISFPVGNERKSGFLFPSFGGSSRGGNALSVPWYWNLAPNYDDTITPTIDTGRGFKLDNEFRYLGDSSKGTLVTGYLPYDNKTHEWRGIVDLLYRNDLTNVLRLDVNAGEVHDKQWFEDFGQTRDSTSTVYLTRTLSLITNTQQWHGELNFQNMQVIDTTIDSADRPYTMLPQLIVNGFEHLPFGTEFKLDSELSYFTRGQTLDTTTPGVVTPTDSLSGARLYLFPQLSLPLRSSGMYVIPSASWHFTRYQLQNTATGMESKPGISAPVYSVDTGLVFERLSGSKSQRLYTLEPRLLYSYVPYRTQSDVPLFDTGMPDFSLVQLFQTNRFLGPDRLGDANQLSAGITTRMLDSRDGQQFLSGTLGQAFYFRTPCVTSLTATTCDTTATDRRSSDMIGQLSLTAYKHWSINVGAQWNPSFASSERGDLSFQYRPGPDRTINLGYSYDVSNNGNASSTVRDPLRQYVGSFAWPINHSWSGYGRVVYSQIDGKVLDHFAGLEYRSCCWNIRTVIGRAVTTRTGEYDTQYRIQLELKGLSSVGTADTFLQSSIPGYSARDRQTGDSSLDMPSNRR